ncbi:hypothetical protein CROQUDRAFT_25629, partial [Cronartium quercuum f. sp. fusiforme G11]
LEYLQAVSKDVEKLESDGFRWTKDMILGIFWQHRALMSGLFSMESINTVLDAKFLANPGPVKSSDIRVEMQSLITNRSITIQADHNVQVMAVTRLTDSPYPASSQSSSRSSRGYRPRPTSFNTASRMPVNKGPKPISLTPEEKDKLWWDPIQIPQGVLDNVKRGEEQCFWCGKFGHSQDACRSHQVRCSKTALHWNNWCRVIGGRMYSINILGIH